jgi:hypothetical protein
MGGNTVPFGMADEFIGLPSVRERGRIAVSCAGLLVFCPEAFVELDDPWWDLFGKR